jgi:hypothetical protein
MATVGIGGGAIPGWAAGLSKRTGRGMFIRCGEHGNLLFEEVLDVAIRGVNE